MADWKKALFELSDTKIVFYLKEHGPVRYSELLAKVAQSRVTLANSLVDLQEQELIIRKIKETRPIGTEYVLTEKGQNLPPPQLKSETYSEIRLRILSSQNSDPFCAPQIPSSRVR